MHIFSHIFCALLFFLPSCHAPVLGSTVVFVPQGGTGTSTFPRNYVLIGSTTGAITAVSTSSLGISGGTPGGSDRQVQFNSSGSLAADWGLSYYDQGGNLDMYVGDLATTSVDINASNQPGTSYAQVYGQDVDGNASFDLFAASSTNGGTYLQLYNDKGNTNYYTNRINVSPAAGPEISSDDIYFPSTGGKFVVSSTTSLFSGVMLSTTTASIGSALTAGMCITATSTIPGAVMSSTTVLETTPKTYPGDAVYWKSYVLNATQVVTKECGVASVVPTASAFNIDVLQ